MLNQLLPATASTAKARERAVDNNLMMDQIGGANSQWFCSKVLYLRLSVDLLCDREEEIGDAGTGIVESIVEYERRKATVLFCVRWKRIR